MMQNISSTSTDFFPQQSLVHQTSVKWQKCKGWKWHKPRAPRLVSSLIRCRSWNDLLTSQPHCVEHVNLWFNCMFGAYIFYLALFSSVSSFPMSLPRPLLSCCCCSWCWLTSKLHRVSQHLLLHVIWHHLTLIPPRWHDVQTEEPVNVAGMCRSKEKTVKLQLLWTAEVYQCMKKKIAGASCDVLMSRQCQDINAERYYIHRKQSVFCISF